MFKQGSNFLWQLAMSKAQHKMKMEESDRLLALEKIEAEKERAREQAKLKEGRTYAEGQETKKTQSKYAGEGRSVVSTPPSKTSIIGHAESGDRGGLPTETTFDDSYKYDPLAQGFVEPPKAKPEDQPDQWRTQKPFRAGNNLVMPQKNLTTGKMEYPKFPLNEKGQVDPKIAFEFENKLRDEFTSGSKIYIEVRNAMGRILSASEDPVTGAGDLALIFNYMKVLDPQSVVRESEFATAETSGAKLEESGVPSFIIRVREKILKGGRLTPRQRNEFVSRARKLYARQEKRHKQFIGQYERLTKNYKLNRENIIIDYVIPPKELAREEGNSEQTEATEEQLKERRRLEQKYNLTPSEMGGAAQ
jgi:hypothetical protein